MPDEFTAEQAIGILVAESSVYNEWVEGAMKLREAIQWMQTRSDTEHKVFTRADSMYRKGYLHAIRDLKNFTNTKPKQGEARCEQARRNT